MPIVLKRPVITSLAAPLMETLSLGDELGVPIQVLGQARGPIIPQRVGDWWMTMYTPETPLPPRAATRLETLLAHGVRPKAIVVFHELDRQPRVQSPFTRNLGRAVRWSQSEGQRLALHAQEAAVTHGPAVVQALSRTGLVMANIAGFVLIRVALAIPYLIAAVVNDPCLVIVTQDDYWIEVDRWVE